jgi:hypothetical protein
MKRSRSNHQFDSSATLNGDPFLESVPELNGTNLTPPDFGARELGAQELGARDLGVQDLNGANGSPVGRSLSGAPLSTASEGKARGLGRTATPPGRALSEEGETAQDRSGGQRALSVLKQALPVVQNLLPLLEGNLLATVGNLLGPRGQNQAKVDLAPLENQLTEMQLLQHDVRGKVAEHHMTLKRVEDQLEMVKEATDRNTMEQQELMEDLRAMGSKVNLFAAMLIGLLVLSVVLNFLLFMHIKQVLP